MNILRRVAGVVAGSALAVVLAVPALAHADLATSSPEDGAVLDTPPTTVEVTFTEGLDAGRSSIRLVGPGGEIAAGRPARNGAKVIRLEGLALGPGAYTIKWTAGAGDGHVERGTIAFTVAAPAATQPSPTQTPAAPSAEPAGTATPAPAAPSEPAGTSAPATAAPSPDAIPAADATGADVIVPIVAALVLVGAGGLLVLRRGRGA